MRFQSTFRLPPAAILNEIEKEIRTGPPAPEGRGGGAHGKGAGGGLPVAGAGGRAQGFARKRPGNRQKSRPGRRGGEYCEAGGRGSASAPFLGVGGGERGRRA